MTPTEDRLLVYFDDEEHLVRRLGMAAISCYQELSAELRYRLYLRSLQICDDHETAFLEEDFRRFIAEHARQITDALDPPMP